MALWQAPSTNNERRPDDGGFVAPRVAVPYLDAGSGTVRWWDSADDIPVGATRLYVQERADLSGVRVFATDPLNERPPLVFLNGTILIR